MPTTSGKVRENRLRAMAQRQRLALTKSRRRDPRAWDYGLWQLVDIDTSTIVIGHPLGYVTLDEVEAYLTRDDR